MEEELDSKYRAGSVLRAADELSLSPWCFECRISNSTKGSGMHTEDNEAGEWSRRRVLAESGPEPTVVQAQARAPRLAADSCARDGTDRAACASEIYSWVPRASEVERRPLLCTARKHFARRRSLRGLGKCLER